MKPKVALVTPKPESHRTAEETIALGYLANVLRQADYHVVTVDGWLRKLEPQEVVSEIALESPPIAPAVIGFSCYRSNLDQAKAILMLARRKFEHFYSICGGYGPTFHDKDFLEAGFDVAVRGEAEHVIVPLIRALMHGGPLTSIQGISFKEGRTERSQPESNLDILPFPARDEISYTIKQKNPVHVCTSRGCFGNCKFCSVIAFAKGSPGRRWRGRSAENIVRELQYLHDEFGVLNFKFVDDSFIEPPRDEKWIKNFADMIEDWRVEIMFRTQIRADRLTLPITKHLKRAGWFATSIGIENGSPTALKRMGKSASLGDNLRALDWLQQNGIYVQMGTIAFDHATTMTELEEQYAFLKNHNWVVTKGIFTEMYAAEGTVFAENLSKQGLLNLNATNQNYAYSISDPQAGRVYQILKKWHKSHALIYDKVIDPIGAPKVMIDDGYRAVYMLCNKLFAYDLAMFRKTIDLVTETDNGSQDGYFVNEEIRSMLPFYNLAQRQINRVYYGHGLNYDAIVNPFLD